MSFVHFIYIVEGPSVEPVKSRYKRYRRPIIFSTRVHIVSLTFSHLKWKIGLSFEPSGLVGNWPLSTLSTYKNFLWTSLCIRPLLSHVYILYKSKIIIWQEYVIRPYVTQILWLCLYRSLSYSSCFLFVFVFSVIMTLIYAYWSKVKIFVLT